MRNELNVHVVGDNKNRKKLMKILEKAKVRFTHIGTINESKEDETKELFDIEFYVAEKKFWKIYRKLDLMGDMTIN